MTRDQPTPYELALRHDLLTRAQEIELAKRIEKGCLESKHQMIEQNLRLAERYVRRYRNQGLDLDDLRQEAALGLNRAAELYDWRKGFRFSTFAVNWIKATISRALDDKSRVVRVPAHRSAEIRRLRRLERDLVTTHGSEPTTAELAAAASMDEADVEFLLAVSARPVSLETPIGDADDAAEFGAMLEDTSGQMPAPFDSAAETLQSEAVRRALESLNYRQRRIIRGRFGIGEPELTLGELGDRFGITAERVRLLEADALHALAELPRETFE